MRRSEVLSALVLAFVLAPAAAPGRPVPARIRPRIVNGLPTMQYPTVGALLYGTGFDSADMICSGTLIGCQTFLTAGHCVEHDTDPAHYSVFLQHAGLFAVTSVALHPSFDFPVGDVAVLRLTTPVTGVAPTPIDTTSFAFGTPATIAGFGNTGGINGDYGLKRVGAAITASCTIGVSDTTSVCWNFTAPLGPPGTDSNTCSGDSGGPLLVDTGGGPRVAGVTSGGNNFDCLPNDVSFDARVYTYRSFIQGIGGADLANTACGTLPQVGSADVTVLGLSGQVSAGSPEGRHAFTVNAGLATLRIAMNAIDDGPSDFDLYVKLGSPPTTIDYDCRRSGSNQWAFCEFPTPAAGTWHVLVSRWSGAGEYQATVTTFRPFCSNPANAGLACDDNNACTSNDICQAGACSGSPVANGTTCADGNECTGPDTCQAGACTGSAVANGTPCDDHHICTRGDRCQAGACVPGASPATACKRPVVAGKGLLFLKDDDSFATRDRLTWRWASGAHTDKSEFGDPTTDSTVGLCLYDDRGSGPVLVLEHAIPPGARWRARKDGYKYNDRTLANAGVRSIVLRSSPTDGHATILVKAQGEGLGLDLPLTQNPTVRAQLVTQNGCWEALYSTHQQSTLERFKARAD
jgi:Trypsin/Bacterial pre-peptidase C-terminal domain